MSHRTPESVRIVASDGELSAVWAEVMARHSISTEIENQGIEPTALGPDLIDTAQPGAEKDALATGILQDQVEKAVLPEKPAETGILESRHVRPSQRHLRVDAADMTAMPLAWILGIIDHAAIVPQPQPK